MSDYTKALREAMAANEDLRAELYGIADEACDIAKAFAPEDEGTFRDSIDVKRVKYRKLGKTTRIARVISTDDPERWRCWNTGVAKMRKADPPPNTPHSGAPRQRSTRRLTTSGARSRSESPRQSQATTSTTRACGMD